jgi:hypothetical protein
MNTDCFRVSLAVRKVEREVPGLLAMRFNGFFRVGGSSISLCNGSSYSPISSCAFSMSVGRGSVFSSTRFTPAFEASALRILSA